MAGQWDGFALGAIVVKVPSKSISFFKVMWLSGKVPLMGFPFMWNSSGFSSSVLYYLWRNVSLPVWDILLHVVLPLSSVCHWPATKYLLLQGLKQNGKHIINWFFCLIHLHGGRWEKVFIFVGSCLTECCRGFSVWVIVPAKLDTLAMNFSFVALHWIPARHFPLQLPQGELQ